MSRQSGKRAAGLMPAAKAEKKRLRAESVVLKQEDVSEGHRFRRSTRKSVSSTGGKPIFPMVSSDALSGVVALVELGPESRARTLRTTLATLGASVASSWNPLVTHVVWSEGGCRDVRARARALAAKVVSPLWVEACAVAQEYLPEKSFPAAPRPSDLPSPKKMQQALKRAEMDNVTLDDFLGSSNVAIKNPKQSRFRISRSSDHKSPDTSGSTTGSIKTRAMTRSAARSSKVTASTPSVSAATARVSTDVENRVNTAPRRALPLSITPTEPQPKPSKQQPLPATQPVLEPEPKANPPQPQQKKSKRRLFTQAVLAITDPEAGPSSAPPARVERPFRAVRAATARAEPPLTTRLTQRERSGLQRAERLARRFNDSITTPRPIYKEIYSRDGQYRIVLSGMAASERRLMQRACRKLGARLQDKVDKKTTHVLVGSLSRVLTVDPMLTEVYSIKGTEDKILSFENGHLRTLSALLGAARGCRVLYATWAYESFKSSKWLHHFGYEVPYFKNISQKAHIERHAFDLMRSEYGYDIFNGRHICLSAKTEKRECVEQLLTLCGAIVFDEYGTVVQNADLLAKKIHREGPKVIDKVEHEAGLFKYDLVIGTGPGEVNSKWVFDSVAATRMRSTRKYINPIPE